MEQEEVEREQNVEDTTQLKEEQYVQKESYLDQIARKNKNIELINFDNGDQNKEMNDL